MLFCWAKFYIATAGSFNCQVNPVAIAPFQVPHQIKIKLRSPKKPIQFTLTVKRIILKQKISLRIGLL
ncbi:hypothetical protein ACLFKQ_08955 [Myxosarcina sp. GI1(2024)]